jgi:integrase
MASDSTALTVIEPTGAIEPIKRRRNPNKPLNEAEIRRLLASIDDLRADALIRLGLSTGLRVSEVITISLGDIDWSAGIVKIWDEKKDRWRHVMPTMDVIGVLRRYAKANKPSRYLFPITTKTAERIIQRYSLKALGYAISWHALRHTYVSRMRAQGQPIEVVIANTGDSAETLLRVYSELSGDVLRKFVEAAPAIPLE